MKNEVYGTVTLDVSILTDEVNEQMALLSENYKYSSLRQKNVYLIFEDIDGIKNELIIHNWELLLTSFFNN